MSEPKTQFEQFYRAFGGYSHGGCNIGGVAYMKRSAMDRVKDWESIVEKLNSAPIIAASKLVVIDDVEYDRLTGG